MKRRHIFLFIMIAVFKAMLSLTNPASETNTKVEDTSISLQSTMHTVDPNRFRASADTLSLGLKK